MKKMVPLILIFVLFGLLISLSTVNAQGIEPQVEYEINGKIVKKILSEVNSTGEFEVGKEYHFIWNSNVTWILSSEDKNLTAVGKEFKVTFESSGVYHLRIVGNENYSYTFVVGEGKLGTYLALIGAGLAVGLSAIGSGIGVGITGASGAAAIGESAKSKFGRILVFQAFPQTQAIYGLLIAIVIMMGIGAFSGQMKSVPLSVGLGAIGAGISVGLAGLSAIGQGIVAGTGIGTTQHERISYGKAVVFSILPETQAIYGLLIAILILYGSGLFGGHINDYSIGVGLAAIGAGLAMGVSGLTAIGQGIAASSSCAATAENPKAFTKGMIFSVIAETPSITALIIAIVVLSATGLLSGSHFMSGPEATFVGLAAMGAGLAVGFAGLSGIGLGIAAGSSVYATMREKASFGKIMVFAIMPETQVIYGLLVAIFIVNGAGLFGGAAKAYPIGIGLATIGAGLAIGVSGLTAIGQGIAAGSGAAASSEEPRAFSKSIIFSVLPETQSIYALIVSIIILYSAGLLGGAPHFSSTMALLVGIGAIGAGLSIGFAGLSGIGQGITAAMGIGAFTRRPESFGKSMMLSVMSETFAIFGLLIAILILRAIGVF